MSSALRAAAKRGCHSVQACMCAKHLAVGLDLLLLVQQLLGLVVDGVLALFDAGEEALGQRADEDAP